MCTQLDEEDMLRRKYCSIDALKIYRCRKYLSGISVEQYIE